MRKKSISNKIFYIIIYIITLYALFVKFRPPLYVSPASAVCKSSSPRPFSAHSDGDTGYSPAFSAPAEAGGSKAGYIQHRHKGHRHIRRLPHKAVTPAGKPKCIISHTVKGKGVSFMENQVGWHGKAPNAEQREQALKELA